MQNVNGTYHHNPVGARQLFALLFVLLAFSAKAQVTTEVDSTTIKIGAQVTYSIKVVADTTDLVIFPEGQTFLPLEVIESYKPDTTQFSDKYNIIKKYGLTQFDSGVYTLPPQKILIGDRTFLTDTLSIAVNPVAVDTTKQAMFGIKPITEVNKSSGKWWLYLLIILLILALVAGLLYWFVWRKKPLTEAEKIAQLPPYERAKKALQELDKTRYLENDEVKAYYSELTGIIRTYLDEKVYDRALESTTEELIGRLELLSDGQQIDLNKEDIKSIETILKRADLVKFAKSKPDIALAELDRKTVDVEIDHVKEALPEPTEEEKLLNQKYKEEQERKRKRRKIIIISAAVLFLLMATTVGLTIKYGFDYVKDSVLGHQSKELLEEKDWVTSEYGAPGITITTPKVLGRIEAEVPQGFQEILETTMFGYGSILSHLNIVVSTTAYDFPAPEEGQESETEDEPKIDLFLVAEGSLKSLETQGVQNLIVKNEQFITPNGAEGLKTFGTAAFPTAVPGQMQDGNYVLLGFTAENILHTIILVWKEDDIYADQIMDRVLNSIELIKLEDE